MITLLLLCFLYSNHCNAFSVESFASKFKLLRGSGTKYTVTDVKIEEDLEYPRNNREILQKVQSMWLNYYSCLEKKAMEEIKPEIVRLIEGQNTEFYCDICEKPFQNYEELEWKYKPLTPDSNVTEPEHLDLSSEMVLTPNLTLKIFNVIEDLAGLYVCYHGINVASIYILEVSKNDTIEKMNRNNPRTPESILMNGSSVVVDYKWSSWSECSTCGTVGRKFKYGFCLVSVKEITADWMVKFNYRDNTENFLDDKEFFNKFKFTTNFINNKNATVEKKENLTWAIKVIDKFRTGIPCTSPYLPKLVFEDIHKFKAVRAAVKFCSVPCDESEIFEVVDNFGKVIEIANNSAGIFSVFQNIPQLPPDIERRSITGDFGKSITIQCPSTLLQNIPVTWKINKKILFPEIIANESNERITIDLVHRIHISKLRQKDSHIYSCWYRDKLAGTVHLNVEKQFKIGFDHHITLIGMMAVIGTFLLVGSKIITRELKNRKK